MRILLDAGVLGDVLNPQARSASVKANVAWAERMLERGEELFIPGIADYEVRRELLFNKAARSIERLDRARTEFEFLPVEQSDLDRAARLWADRKHRGRPAAPDAALDADAILCAQAQRLAESAGGSVLVATTNTKHLTDFVDARLPSAIT
jgi:predicted nucleic acid-binding protein